MNEIEKLKAYVDRCYRVAFTEIEAPLRPDGIWSLDVRLGEQHLNIEWSEDSGFGISTVNFATFGETADERVKTLEAARARIGELLDSGQKTRPPMCVFLRRLREERDLTQTELARRLKVQQASIAGMEKRNDIQVTTLDRVICALEGRLEIWAVFPDARYRLELGSSHSEAVRSDQTILRAEQVETIAISDDHFSELKQTGLLDRAHRAASALRHRKAPLEIP